MQVEWRRTKALELLSKGNSQSEIAKVLHLSKDTGLPHQCQQQ
jgi:DNA-binding NarL/FixJ family response regulator